MTLTWLDPTKAPIVADLQNVGEIRTADETRTIDEIIALRDSRAR
jgi:hypothetical protein